MTDPTYALIFAVLVGGLATAMVIPAPSREAGNEGAIQLWLQGAGCVAVLFMGALALSGHPAECAIAGAAAWLLVMPCVWLSRAPRPDDGWYEEYADEDDDDDGGSPPPDRPEPSAPENRLPGWCTPALPATRAAWSAGAPKAAPVVATAARVQMLLAAEEARRAQVARDVQRMLAATAGMPLPQPEHAAAPAPLTTALALPQPIDATAPDPTTLGAPPHHPDPHELQPLPRVRGDHGSIAHLLAAVADVDFGRRKASKRERRQPVAH